VSGGAGEGRGGRDTSIHEGVMADAHDLLATIYTCICIYTSHQKAVRGWWQLVREEEELIQVHMKTYERVSTHAQDFFNDYILLHIHICITPEGSSWVVAMVKKEEEVNECI